jgi:CII-binding regulator of phage lambda lysogenization HflD
MGVTQPSVFPDVFKAFYNLLNTYISDPLDRTTQWIFSSNPYEDLEEGKVKFPILIIEPADMSWEIFTITKKWNVIKLRISAYSTQMAQADQLLSKIAYTINYFALNLKYEQGLDFVLLTETETNFELFGGTRSHIRTGTFSMRNAWASGIGKHEYQKIISSILVISAPRKNMRSNTFVTDIKSKIISSKSSLLKINHKTLNCLLKMKTHNLKTISSVSYIEHRTYKTINSRIYLRKKNQYTKISFGRIKKLSKLKTITSWNKIKGHVRKNITSWSRISK